MKKNIIIALLVVTPIFVFSQQSEIRKADLDYNSQNYFKAIKIFSKIVEKGNETPEIIEKLANANFFNANYEQANVWYTKLSQVSNDMKSEEHYRFALTLKSVGKLEEAKVQLEIYKNLNPNEKRALLVNTEVISDSKFVFSNVKSITINSKYSDYGPTLYKDNLLFSSANNVVLNNTLSERTNQYRTNLYQTVKTSNGEFSKPKLFSKVNYSIYNEATPVFSKDGNTIYYTQNQLVTNSKVKLVNGVFKLYRSVLVNNKWENKGPINFGLNDEVRIAHPAISPDGKFIYFASDNLTKYGESDLFRASILDDSTFGIIENLGDKINTEGRDSYPYITPDNTLIFASDGRPGMGGFDLYSIDLNNPEAKVIPLGNDINSPFDDFGITMNNEMTNGYFTSNKPGGKGDDDIYSFDLSIKKIELIAIKGTIVDEETKQLLPNAELNLFDSNKVLIVSIHTDSNGEYSVKDLKPNSTYSISVKKEGYEDASVLLDLKTENFEKAITIKTIKTPYKIGDDLSEILKLHKIYFDLGKFTIRPESKIELDKVVTFLNQYTTLKIEVGSHTDSRQSNKLNHILSENRAKATLAYLVKNGIKPERLIANGYGESKLINNCIDGVPCTEEQHQQNRRSTFIILSEK